MVSGVQYGAVGQYGFRHGLGRVNLGDITILLGVSLDQEEVGWIQWEFNCGSAGVMW